MIQELIALEHKIEVSRRIITKGPEGGDPILHGIIVEELESQLPSLERRVRQLEIEHEDRRR